MSGKRSLFTAAAGLLGFLVLVRLGVQVSTPPLGKPTQLESWWTSVGTPMATVALARLLGLVLCGYLAIASSLVFVATATRWTWMLDVSSWFAAPLLRRAVVSGTFAVALGAAVAPSVADAHDDVAAVELVTDQRQLTYHHSPTHSSEPEPVAELEQYQINQGADELDWDEFDDDFEVAGPLGRTWLVMPGENLWGIAADVVQSRSGLMEPHDVLTYWMELVELNAYRLGSDHQHLTPGVVLMLPN